MSMLVNKRILGSIIILGILTLALIGAVCIPTIYSINGLEQKIAGEQNKIEARYLTRQSVRESLNDLEKAKLQLKELRRVAVVEGEELAFINSLESTMEATKVDAKFSLEMPNQKILSFWEREVPVRINVTGSANGIIQFINGIERLPYIVTIRDLSFRRNIGQGNAAVDLSGSIYWISKEAPEFVRTGDVAADKTAETKAPEAPAKP